MPRSHPPTPQTQWAMGSYTKVAQNREKTRNALNFMRNKAKKIIHFSNRSVRGQAVAIAYDMWEDKEFVKETEPGVVPPMPMPQNDTY